MRRARPTANEYCRMNEMRICAGEIFKMCLDRSRIASHANSLFWEHIEMLHEYNHFGVYVSVYGAIRCDFFHLNDELSPSGVYSMPVIKSSTSNDKHTNTLILANHTLRCYSILLVSLHCRMAVMVRLQPSPRISRNENFRSACAQWRFCWWRCASIVSLRFIACLIRANLNIPAIACGCWNGVTCRASLAQFWRRREREKRPKPSPPHKDTRKTHINIRHK